MKISLASENHSKPQIVSKFYRWINRHSFDDENLHNDIYEQSAYYETFDVRVAIMRMLISQRNKFAGANCVRVRMSCSHVISLGCFSQNGSWIGWISYRRTSQRRFYYAFMVQQSVAVIWLRIAQDNPDSALIERCARHYRAMTRWK